MPYWFETIRHLRIENTSDKQNGFVDKEVISSATSWKQFVFKVFSSNCIAQRYQCLQFKMLMFL